MVRLLHISDVHVQVDYRRERWFPLGWRRWAAMVEMVGFRREVRYAQAEATLAALANEAVRHRADHVILSGDLTAMALADEFRRARAALDAVARPGRFSVIPGNHDVYAPDAVREDRFGAHFGEFLASDAPEHAREGPYPYVHFVGDEAAVIGLCSARVPLVPGAAVGWVGRAQLDGLEAILRDPRMAQRFAFIAVHHAPLGPRGRPDMPTHGLSDAKALMRIAGGPRRAVVFGHIHQRYTHPPTHTRPRLFCAGSSTSRGREGYWLYEVERGELSSARMLRLGE